MKRIGRLSPSLRMILAPVIVSIIFGFASSVQARSPATPIPTPGRQLYYQISSVDSVTAQCDGQQNNALQGLAALVLGVSLIGCGGALQIQGNVADSQNRPT
jgi:hypothetical protein